MDQSALSVGCPVVSSLPAGSDKAAGPDKACVLTGPIC
jgi:hypothetical protein